MKKVSLIARQDPVVVLVRPQLAENVGMVARAMMNCGLSSLRLVSPREDHLSDKAVSASSGAAEILEQARVFDSLENALADMHCVFCTTARVRDMTKPWLMPQIAIEKTERRIMKHENVAWVFGPERTGLENRDIILADACVQIPLNPVHSSLNLSQAVLIMGYLWWNRFTKDSSVLMTGKAKSASKKELALFLAFLDKRLERAGYYAFPEKKDRMQRNLHNIFERNNLTSSELKTLYNILKMI